MESLKRHLNLADGDVDEDLSVALVSLITSAVRDEHAERTLHQIAQAIMSSDTASSLEPLTLLPLLLPFHSDDAAELLKLMAGQCSAKEMIMAAQESLEVIERVPDSEEQVVNEQEGSSAFGQIDRLLQIYSIAIPRLPRRNKSPVQILKPIIPEINTAISQAGISATAEDGRSLILSVSKSVLALYRWGTVITPDYNERAGIIDILYHLLSSTLETCANDTYSNLAQKAFEKQFSRLVIRPSVESGSSKDVDVVGDAWAAMTALGLSIDTCESKPSISSLILLAHSPAYSFSLPTLTSFFPVILTAIQCNTALDEALSLLLNTLPPLRQQSPPPSLPADLLVPLTHVLASLASVHRDPATRHQTFRLLSTALALAPAQLRLHLLQDLLTDRDASPHMRVAAVGLVKEAVLEALARAASAADVSVSVFASPALLHTLGPVLLRPDPPDVFAGAVALGAFLESPEPLRLVECLAFYYVLLSRDTQNRTGVRDPEAVADVERGLVGPLRRQLARWNEELGGSGDREDHAGMQLGILDMWLERVSGAMSALPKV